MIWGNAARGGAARWAFHRRARRCRDATVHQTWVDAEAPTRGVGEIRHPPGGDLALSQPHTALTDDRNAERFPRGTCANAGAVDRGVRRAFVYYPTIRCAVETVPLGCSLDNRAGTHFVLVTRSQRVNSRNPAFRAAAQTALNGYPHRCVLEPRL